MQEVKDIKEIAAAVNEGAKVVLLFSHEHCAACPQVEAHLEESRRSAEDRGWQVCKFNVIRLQPLPDWHVTSVPAVLIFAGGGVARAWRRSEGSILRALAEIDDAE